MNELRNDQELTTADIANPQRNREYRSAVIDEPPSLRARSVAEHRRAPHFIRGPVAQKKEAWRMALYSVKRNCKDFDRGGTRFRLRLSMSRGWQ